VGSSEFLNGGEADGVKGEAMKKTFFLASLVSLLLLSGCHGTRSALSSRFKPTIPVKIEIVEGRVRLSHDREPALHHVKLEMLVSDDGVTVVQERGKIIETTPVWESFRFLNSKLRYLDGVSWVEVSGWSDEGKLKGYWTARFSAD
jgi:hypothetical protein